MAIAHALHCPKFNNSSSYHAATMRYYYFLRHDRSIVTACITTYMPNLVVLLTKDALPRGLPNACCVDIYQLAVCPGLVVGVRDSAWSCAATRHRSAMCMWMQGTSILMLRRTLQDHSRAFTAN
jgi:hypothetical protein